MLKWKEKKRVFRAKVCNTETVQEMIQQAVSSPVQRIVLEGKGMFIEGKSIQELRTFIREKGYFSKEAKMIGLEIESSKREYEYLIQNQEKMPGRNQEAESVVQYYLYQLEQLKYKLPYDAMSCHVTVPLLLLEKFQKEDIAGQIISYIGNRKKVDTLKLTQEIQKFINVQLNPKGIVLYMDILSHSSLGEKCHAGNGT